QIVDLRAAYVAPALQLDLVDYRAVQRKRALHTDAETHLTDGECFTDAIACSGDDHTGEDLDSRTSALNDLDVHLDGIAWTEGGDITAHRCLIELVNELAHETFLASATGHHARTSSWIASRREHSPCGRCRTAGRQPSSLPHPTMQDEIVKGVVCRSRTMWPCWSRPKPL